MTVVGILDTIVEWAKSEVCSKIRLKSPPEDDGESNSAGYDYKLITPACFPFFVPSKDKLPPSISTPIPSLCVRILEGDDNLAESRRMAVVEFAFSTWSTGTHGKDFFLKHLADGMRRVQWTGEEAEKHFTRNNEGWRDAWNWVDIALREIENTPSIGGIEIDRAAGVKFYPFKEQESIPDYTPFWFTGIQFTVKLPLVRNVVEYEELL